MGLIWCLHGFLGRPSDWDVLPFPHRAVDLFAGERFEPSSDDVVIGYSMGGRLALQILEDIPVRKAVIISAGLNAPDAERRAREEHWAHRFERQEWSSLMADWNTQAVFGGHEVERAESDFDRKALGRALREWSPAVMPPPRLENIDAHVLWIAGERDRKYVEIAEHAVARIPHAELWICPDAGHRVPWEQPGLFVARLRAFLELQ